MFLKILGVLRNKLYQKRFGIFNALYYSVLPILSLFSLLILYPFLTFDDVYNLVATFPLYLFVFALVINIISFINFIRSVVYSQKIYKKTYDVVKINEHLILKCGMPGTGKTLTAVNQALLTADCVWGDLVTEYWELSSKTDYQFQNNSMLKKRFRIVKNAFDFWSSFDGIKCFASNIPVERNGKFGIMLTKGMLEQKEWLPPFCVCLGDEIGSFATLKESMVGYKNYPMEDEGRFSRHFEYWFIYTEQQPENFNKSLRNVVGLNELMSGMEWILQPKLLILVCKLLRWFGLRFWIVGKYVRFYSILNNFCKNLGYFSFNSDLMGNMVLGGKPLGKQNIKTFHSFDFNYDSKCFSSMYLCKDFEPIVYRWRSTSLPKDSPIAKSIRSKYN